MRNRQFVVLMLFIALVAGVVLVVQNPRRITSRKDIAFGDLVVAVDGGKVAGLTIRGAGIEGTFTDGSAFRSTGPASSDYFLQRFADKGVVPAFEPVEDAAVLSTVLNVAAIILILILFLLFLRQVQAGNGKAMSFGKSRPKMLSESGKRVTFDDVAGCDEAKEELQEVIQFLKDPRKFTRLGGRIPKGVLLMGSPGAGKTLLGRAVAGEAGVPFFSISGSEFVEMFVGVGASRVRDLFEQAKKQAPCIVFIDEIDAVGRHRGGGMGGGHDEREQTLNQLLVEMDGFDSSEGVILIAATNRPDVLDQALMRPGRFDRRVVVPSPDVRGRLGILQVHARRVPLADAVDLDRIAKGTSGFSGADLENVINEAALLAARADKKQVEQVDLETAKDKVAMGAERRSLVQSDDQRRRTAFHEAGHAIVARMTAEADPVSKITIVPRAFALGLTQMLPSEDRLVRSRGQIMAMITVLLGGRAAEELIFEERNTGAGDDLKRATRLAQAVVCEYGMTDELGPVAWGERHEEPFLGGGFSRRVPDYSEETARKIDAEVRQLVGDAHARARRLLHENLHVLRAVAEKLLEKETLDGLEFERLVDSLDPVVPRVA